MQGIYLFLAITVLPGEGVGATGGNIIAIIECGTDTGIKPDQCMIGGRYNNMFTISYKQKEKMSIISLARTNID